MIKISVMLFIYLTTLLTMCGAWGWGCFSGLPGVKKTLPQRIEIQCLFNFLSITMYSRFIQAATDRVCAAICFDGGKKKFSGHGIGKHYIHITPTAVGLLSAFHEFDII